MMVAMKVDIISLVVIVVVEEVVMMMTMMIISRRGGNVEQYLTVAMMDDGKGSFCGCSIATSAYNGTSSCCHDR